MFESIPDDQYDLDDSAQAHSNVGRLGEVSESAVQQQILSTDSSTTFVSYKWANDLFFFFVCCLFFLRDFVSVFKGIPILSFSSSS